MLILYTLSVLVDLSSKDSSPHSLGSKYRSEYLPHATELYLLVEKAGCLKLYLELSSLKVLQMSIEHSLHLTLHITMPISSVYISKLAAWLFPEIEN